MTPTCLVAITSDMRSIVSPSSPLVALTRIAPATRCGTASRMTARQPCDGMAQTTSSVSASACASDFGWKTPSGRRMSGRYTTFARRCTMSRTVTDRAPTGALHVRRQPGARQAPSPSCRLQAPQRDTSCSRSNTALSPTSSRYQIAPMPEDDQRGRCARRRHGGPGRTCRIRTVGTTSVAITEPAEI